MWVVKLLHRLCIYITDYDVHVVRDVSYTVSIVKGLQNTRLEVYPQMMLHDPGYGLSVKRRLMRPSCYSTLSPSPLLLNS